MTITLREKELNSGKKSLYLDIYKDGKRRYEFLKLYLTGNKQEDKQTRKLAENIRAKRQLELAHNEHGFNAPHKKKVDFMAYFERDRDTFGAGTKKQYNNLYKKLKAYAGDRLEFGEITPEWVEGFRDFLLDELGNNTARTYFAMFKASLKRAVPKIIPESPARHVKNITKENGKKIHYLELEELKALKAAECPNEEVKAAFLFSCNTGLRYSDVEKLLWNEVRGDRIEFMQKKTANVEYLDLNKQALAILRERDNTLPNVFQLPTNATANVQVKEWAKNAGLKRWMKIVDDKTGEVLQQGLTYHCSRHTFAVQILAYGGDIYTLKELLGHTSITSTEVYAQVVNKTKKKTVNQLPEL